MTLTKHIIPAIIAKHQEELTQRLTKVIDYVDIIQLDVMDNIFVPNTSLFFDFELPKSSVRFEAHLMVQDPAAWIEKNGEKVDMILVHSESDMEPRSIIQQVRDCGKEIGFVLNPETPLTVLDDLLDDIDQVLIMTVQPGFYGSSFLPEMLDKIRALRRMKPDLNIEVDGGITDATIRSVEQAGANLFVSGSYIVKSDRVQQAITTLEELVGGG
jgi:ribulose-phosphate 3-epimerase